MITTKNQTEIKAEPGKQELFITREFEAPRELVFRAFTDPELIVRWLGPRELKMRIDQFDCRSGGAYRYIHTDPAGNDYGFHGVIHDVTAPERIIQTFEFEGLPESGHVTLETTRFEALPGNRTKVTVQSVFQSVADRDGMLQSGMERGVNDSHWRLDELFEAGEIK
ncbi:SRPBCC family protein [Mucilaginibacter rubeus]|uniref:SRPBCC family protein n=1 Tax=Mucilaginibacter rubeus TaxID=2027860 RepID=A0AAE6JDK1_9SPHI|nr:MULTISPECIES: SRPBCC family protein [Mucilaginibacter]QEM03421.1 SRPBCC family protein [Mucilaginibacter rubeus]QEM16036.1 SRPBCC family protein [Mucilaginibacter gossypii]QTE41214.1 SRPBCC family protein [Mucilaginibacter rubeus]QTE47818.1 SRPBCC family protein [Mucilaginibacter rubeus]QTE59209.1 SRPBCC family protein [Mucilaginibacter rubeus]